MGKVEIDIKVNAADWTPLSLLLGIYFFYFNERRPLIKQRIIADYEKEKKKIKDSFIIGDQTLSSVDRVHRGDNVLTMDGLIRRIKFIRCLRNAVTIILNVSFFVVFAIFGCRILFITTHLFLMFLPSMYLAGIILTLFIIIMLCIVASYPGEGE